MNEGLGIEGDTKRRKSFAQLQKWGLILRSAQRFKAFQEFIVLGLSNKYA